VSTKIKDRHLLGAGAAACAICCAPPILALLGLAGAGLVATVATVAFAGLTFGAVVLVASLLAVWAGRGNSRTDVACADEGPVEVTVTARPVDTPRDPGAGR
jgi:uncharacterized protein (DUF58 family)